MSRLRSSVKSEFLGSQQIIGVQDGNVFYDSGALVTDFYTSGSAIYDISSPHSAQRKYPWKPCSHVRYNSVPGTRPTYTEYNLIAPGVVDPFNPIKEIWSYSGKFGAYDWHNSESSAADMLGNFMPGLHSANGILPADVAAKHTRRALDNILQQMPVTVSVVNMIWELRGGLKTLLPRLLGSPLKKMASGWLWWNFGFMPLINDIKALLSLFADVNKRLDYLLKINRRPVTLRYRGHWTGDQQPFLGAPASKDSSYIGQGAVLWEDAKLRMNTRVFYDLDLQGADTFLKGCCAALGLLDPANIVWQAIPWSFIIDWFVKTDDWIEANLDTAQPFEGTLQILGSDCTIEKRTMIGYACAIDNLGNYEIVDQVLVRGYHRRAGCFGENADQDGLNPTQLSLLLALLVQGLGK